MTIQWSRNTVFGRQREIISKVETNGNKYALQENYQRKDHIEKFWVPHYHGEIGNNKITKQEHQIKVVAKATMTKIWCNQQNGWTMLLAVGCITSRWRPTNNQGVYLQTKLFLVEILSDQY